MFDRNLRRSLFDYVRGLLLSPPAGTFASAWNVYGHAEMRSTTHEPVWPFVYLVDRNIEPTETRVPAIVLEMGAIQKFPYELGSRNGHLFSADLNVFGRDSASRDDLATFIRDNFGLSFSIYNYETSGSPIIDTAHLLDEPFSTPVSLGEEVGLEGSLWNFTVVSIEGSTLT